MSLKFQVQFEEKRQIISRPNPAPEQESQGARQSLADIIRAAATSSIIGSVRGVSGHVSLGRGKKVPEQNPGYVSRQFQKAQSHQMRVLSIATALSPHPQLEPWNDMKHLTIEAELRLGDVFELAKFMPSLEKLDAQNVTTHSSSCYDTTSYSCNGYCNPMDLTVANNKLIIIDMGMYVEQLLREYVPLTNSRIVFLNIKYCDVISAVCRELTVSLCKWYFTALKELVVTGTLLFFRIE